MTFMNDQASAWSFVKLVRHENVVSIRHTHASPRSLLFDGWAGCTLYITWGGERLWFEMAPSEEEAVGPSAGALT